MMPPNVQAAKYVPLNSSILPLGVTALGVWGLVVAIVTVVRGRELWRASGRLLRRRARTRLKRGEIEDWERIR
jgi:hypothetical protein